MSPITIIGAGLGGLSLAQGLKKAGLPFRVFERDSSASFRGQGYRIRISADAGRALRHLLPSRHWDVFEATAAELRDHGHQIDASSGATTRWASGPPRQAQGATKAYNIDRAVLRNLLLHGVRNDVTFDRRFVRYDTKHDNGMRLKFLDGNESHAQVVVGADGVQSPVRRQRMPNLELLDTEGRAVYGKTPITKGFFERAPAELDQGLTLIGESNDSTMKLFCDAMHFDQQGAGAEAAASLGLQLPHDYLYWVLVFRRDVHTGFDLAHRLKKHLNPAESAQLSLDLTKHWSSRVRTILTEQDIDAAATLTFLAANPTQIVSNYENLQDAAADSVVTLLGDAAHPMPPVGGFGANSAFEDANSLCDAIVKSMNDTTTMAEAIKSYEQQMRFRAEGVVERSVKGSGRFFGMRPIAKLETAQHWST